jgi:hypothetical protein
MLQGRIHAGVLIAVIAARGHTSALDGSEQGLLRGEYTAPATSQAMQAWSSPSEHRHVGSHLRSEKTGLPALQYSVPIRFQGSAVGVNCQVQHARFAFPGPLPAWYTPRMHRLNACNLHWKR